MTFSGPPTALHADANSGGQTVHFPVSGRVLATAFSRGYHFGHHPLLALGMRSSIVIFLTNFHQEDRRLEKVDIQLWREVRLVSGGY